MKFALLFRIDFFLILLEDFESVIGQKFNFFFLSLEEEPKVFKVASLKKSLYSFNFYLRNSHRYLFLAFVALWKCLFCFQIYDQFFEILRNIFSLKAFENKFINDIAFLLTKIYFLELDGRVQLFQSVSPKRKIMMF